MKLRSLCGAWALCLVFVAASAVAGPKEKGKSAKGKAPCSAKSAKTVSDKAPCHGKDVKKASDKTPCNKPCGKKAKTHDGRSELTAASDKAPCHGKDVKKASDKAPCSKPCGSKSAKTVSDKAPCHGPKAKTASGKKGGCGGGCGSGCKCGQGAAFASGKTPCGNKGSKLTSGKEPCHKSAKTAGDGGCPFHKKAEAILTSMPAMKYRVGKEVIGCSKSAAAMAEQSGKTLKYVVGDDSYSDKAEAVIKLTSVLEGELDALQGMQFVVGEDCGRCPMTAKSQAKKSGKKMTYRVGGFDFDKKSDAEKVVKLVSDAVSKISMAYKVDGKTYHCDKSAGAKCKKTGKKMTYVIGEDETGCKQSAALMLAETKVRTVVEAAAQAAMSL